MAEKTIDQINRVARDFYNKAHAALERGNADYAVEMFMQCVAMEPNFTKARQFLRHAQLKRQETVGGLKRAYFAAKVTSLLPKAKLAVSKNPVEAMSLAEQILSDDPKNSQALQILAEAAENAKYPETTVQTLEYLTKLNPRDTKALHWLARSYAAVERFDMTREVYERLLQINPHDFEAQKGLKDSTAHGAMQTGGWDQATSYRDVMKDKDEAVKLEQEGRVVRAEDVVENLIRENLAKLAADPENQLVQRELGKLYSQKGDYETALTYLERIFGTEGGSDPALEREIADIKIKRLDAVIESKRKELAANPGNAGTLQSEINQLQVARDQVMAEQMERLVERYPNDLLYRFDLGTLYMRTGKIQEAIEQFQKSVGQPQRRVQSLNYLGQCFQQLGLHDLAIDQFARAIEEYAIMDNLKKELIYNLGCAYEAMGETAKAIAEFKKVAAVDYGYRDVKSKIMRKPAGS
jgi:tetratricopeptide (TPR) repeat protein